MALDNTQLNSTIFKYGNSTQGMTVTDFTPLSGDVISRGDFNGDGYTDIVTGTKGTVNGNQVLTSFSVFIKNTNNNNFTLTHTENIAGGFFTFPINSFLGSNNTAFVNDANADGKDDIIIVTTNASALAGVLEGIVKIFSASNTSGTSFTSVQRPLNVTDNSNTANNRCTLAPKNNFFTGDFNGDGKIEFIALLGVCNNLLPPHKAFVFSSDLGDMSIANQPKELLFDTPLLASEIDKIKNADDVRVIDFDGDGKSELMVVVDGSCIIYTFSMASNGSLSAKKTVMNSGLIPKSRDNSYLSLE
jgi:hypothetical protein